MPHISATRLAAPLPAQKTCGRCQQEKPIEAFAPSQRPLKTPNCKECFSDWSRESRYGITPEQFTTLLVAQDGKCAICQTIPKTFDVDHDHETGVVRGLLCRPCNRGLGLFVDDPDRLTNAAVYLRHFK